MATVYEEVVVCEPVPGRVPDIVDVYASDAQIEEGVETGEFFPASETCKADSDPGCWKELSFKTIEDYQAFYCAYAIDAGFSMRIASTTIRRCIRDGVTRVRYQDLCCWKHGFKPGSSLNPANAVKVVSSPKQKIITPGSSKDPAKTGKLKISPVSKIIP
ncbi:hypothetical protein LINGRAHAP2_LOCUS3951, partial [Linum grandiflorum]